MQPIKCIELLLFVVCFCVEYDTFGRASAVEIPPFATQTYFQLLLQNFGAKAERSYIFLRFEAENVLKMFLNYMVYTTVFQ